MRSDFEKLSIIKVGIVYAFFFVLAKGIIRVFNVEDTSIISMGICLFIIISILYMIKRNKGKLELNFHIFKIKQTKIEIIKLYIINLGLSIGLLLIVKIIIQIIHPQDMEKILNDRPVTGVGILTFIYAVVVAPIFEEITFRGILFTKLAKKFNVILAMIVSSAIFAEGHVTMNIGGAFCFGVISCMLFRKYDNILVNISLHMMGNFMIFLANISNVISAILGLTGILMFIPSIYFLIKYIKDNKETFKKDESYELKEVS